MTAREGKSGINKNEIKEAQRGKRQRREIKMDKEIMSDEWRKPEEPTRVSDVVAQRQHLGQL